MAAEYASLVTRLGNPNWINHHRIVPSKDPCMAICHLLRDSSLSITEKLSSIVIPATTITRLSIREQREIESGSLEEETFEVVMY